MDEETKQRFLQQAIDIFINPEIEKRKKLGRIKENFILSRAQIVFSLDRGWNKVRLNEEIKAVLEAIPNRKIEKEDMVTEKDIDEINNIKLTDDDKNCAHITLFFFKNSWIVSFDFRYNKQIAKEHIVASKEFYESAIDNLNKNRLRPFFEDAFASAELCTKSILLTLPNKTIIYDKSHSYKINKFKNEVELGNAPKKYLDVLIRLKSLRSSARYLSSTEFKKENPTEIIKTIEEMINFSEGCIK